MTSLLNARRTQWTAIVMGFVGLILLTWIVFVLAIMARLECVLASLRELVCEHRRHQRV